MVQSGKGKLLVQSDVCNNPLMFMNHTDWIAPFDNDPALTLKTRHKFYDMASAEKVLVAGYHFSFPAVGHVEKNGKNFRLVPVLWTPLCPPRRPVTIARPPVGAVFFFGGTLARAQSSGYIDYVRLNRVFR